MIYSTRAIVLRTVRYGETSLIVDMYTEQKGHQTFIIHSVRKSKATTPPSYLQLLSLVDIVGYFKEQRKIHHMKEVRLGHPYQSIPFDPRKSAVITCLAEICSRTVTTADPHPELFSFLHDQLIGYDDPTRYDRDFMIRFLVQLSHFLGFGMDTDQPIPDEGFFDLQEGLVTRQPGSHLYLMGATDFRDLRAIMDAGPGTRAEVVPVVRSRIVDQLITYYQLHVESLREVNSIRIWRELL